MAFNLKKVLKALLFSSNQPLATKDIQSLFTRFHETAILSLAPETETPAGPTDAAPAAVAAPALEEVAEIFAEQPGDAELYQDVPSLVTATQIRETMDEIAAELRASAEGLLLIEGANGYRLVTHPQFARWVRILRNDPPPLKLSQSSVETLAIVAYRQPVTRAEIENIRGVSAEAGVNKLLERELIYIVGRADLPGRPIQYGTTDQFLEFVGIKSLDELPASDVLSNRQIDQWLQTATNPVKPPADAEMGLPLEQGEGETPNLEAVSVDHTTTESAGAPSSAEETTR
ncbi:MAG: SMC-Scp complex subunit ScpB [Opitutaceae bacterium]|nr:SMC-Scp complex subunit ScpB [Opitutaceae bacterium]MBP9912929.1 SMC-Scp complex subunit ScpB [Opitutaceae bacterium]